MKHLYLLYYMTGYEFGGKGSCSGDSGGPLILFTYVDGPLGARYIQQGIVQGAIGSCGSGKLPSIYVRIKDPEVFMFIQSSITSKWQIP